MKRFFLFIFILCFVYAKAQNNFHLIATENALFSVRLIQVGQSFGTSFIANYKNSQYLITVRHIFKSIKRSGDTANLLIADKNGFLKISLPVFFNNDTTIDVAVVKVPSDFLPNRGLPLLTNYNTAIGQDCYFLGFPLGFGTSYESYYLPIYKRAIFSGIIDQSKSKMVFDAHNNQGFSGAPVISTNSTVENQYLVGVVSGYANESKQLESKKKKNKHLGEFQENSGIMMVYGISNIIEIIKENNL